MKNWHNIESGEVLRELNSDAAVGLSAEEVGLRRDKFGLNKFVEKKKEALIVQVLRQLKDVAVMVLLVAAGLSTFLAISEFHENGWRGFVEPIVILSIVVINVILAVTQERGAERALEALSKLNSPSCHVIRGGEKIQIDTEFVVPGEIIVLKTGDLVPADARIIECESFAVDEASLTGESEPSEKIAHTLEEADVPLGDQKNLVFSGCLVVAGRATAVVTGIGMDTQIGKIAGFITQTKKYKTPLQMRLDKVIKLITGLAIAAAILLLTIGLVNQKPFMHMALLAVALAVAAVPETMALIVTLMLTHGVKKMVTKNALIRKLQAVETLGSTSVICSDKTGTLTMNKMAIKRLWLAGEDVPFPDSAEFNDDQLSLIEKFTLATNAVAKTDENGKTVVIGSPTEAAMLRLLIDKGGERAAL